MPNDPMTESLGLPAGASPQSLLDYLRAATARPDTQGMTQMGPSTAGAMGPSPRVMTQPQGQSAGTFGPGMGAARQREARQNLISSAQSVANVFAQKAQQKQQREYQQTIGRYTGALQGMQQAQAQQQQGQQLIQAAQQVMKTDPQKGQQLLQQGQQMLQQAQQAQQQNKTILDDLSNDKKAHKVITKAFGIDDKNANSPERQAAIQTLQKQMGVGAGTAGVLSQLPQQMQLSPQAQQQQMARQAGVVGAPATEGQILSSATQMAKTDKIEAGKDARAAAKDQLAAAFKGMKYDDAGKLVPMTKEEISANPVLAGKAAIDESKQQLMQAQTELAKARATAIPEQMKIAQAHVGVAEANLGMRQKEFGLKVEEETRRRWQAEQREGPMSTDATGASVEAATGGRPLEPWAQKTISETMPVFDQISSLKSQIEQLGLKDNNTPGYLLLPRMAYAAGFGGEEGKLSASISQIELDRVVGAARILKGSSRALPALQQAMIHLPDAWKGSPKQMYQQLSNVEEQLKQLNQEALSYGVKHQKAGEIEQRLQKQHALPNAAPAASSAPTKPASDPAGIF